MHALQYNKYFTTVLLHASQRKDMLQLLAIALEKNDTITYVQCHTLFQSIQMNEITHYFRDNDDNDSEIIITHLLEPKSGFTEFAEAVKNNRKLAVKTIDLTGTKMSKALGSAAPAAFADGILHFYQGLNALVLNYCELNAKVSITLLSLSLSLSQITNK